MIASGRFVFLHLHKSGGSFVTECLLRFFPDARRLGYHLPASLLPPDLRALPLLGFVRSPWSYYVSWYAFQSQRPRPNALFRIVSEDGTLSAQGTLTASDRDTGDATIITQSNVAGTYGGLSIGANGL